MFQYEFEKRPASAHSCESQATVSTDWSRSYMDRHHRMTSRPLPPRPIHDRIPVKPTVPLKVWIVASASCFAVCAVLVLATVVVTRWGTSEYTAREIHSHEPEPMYSEIYSKSKQATEEVTAEPRLDEDNELPILEKLSFFKNIVNRNRNVDLKSKTQIHPIHEAIEHKERKIEKKDKPKPPINYDLNDINNDNDLAATETDASEKLLESEDNNFAPISFNKKTDRRIETLRAKNNDVSSFDVNAIEREIKNIGDTIVPEFKPLNSEVLIKKVKLPVSYLETLRTEVDYDEYYNDINLYDDYMQSNTMTSYLIEKVQELHNWLTKDSDFDVIKNSTKNRNDFGEVLKALNESLIEGNASVVLNKLKEIYFGENFTIGVHGRRSMLGNETDLLSFGILSLDVMLLHNIQTMAWESQETARINMMKDPNVFAFNALFMDPSKVEAKMNEQNQPYDVYPKRQNKLTPADDYGFGKNLFENILEIGMGTARAAIHLGRVYKNTRSVLNQMSNKENTPVLPRNIDENTHALNRLQSSYSRNGSVASSDGFYTELDCVWLLYCRNLAATSKLNPPYGTMARINGVALRMLAGELSGDKALDTMLYEVFAGWTELKCDDMFPKCSKVNAASVVLETILQPAKKTQQFRGR